MQEQSNSAKAVKAGIGYTVGNILIRGINFLVLPFLARLMDAEQFGTYNVFTSYEGILYVITGLALHSSVKSAHYVFKGETDCYVSSISLIYVINFFALLSLILLFNVKLSQFLNLNRITLYMLALHSSGSALLILYNSRISLEYSFKKYLIISFINTIGNVGLSLLLMLTVFREAKALGRIIGSSLVIAVIALYLLFDLYKRAIPKYNKRYWIFGVRYSLPIVPHGISQILLSQFDRIMIRSLASDAAVGIYSLAANIGTILSVITGSIATAWTTWFFEEIDKKNKKIIQRRSSQIVGLFALLTLVCMAISPELILILGGNEYSMGKYVSIPLIVNAFILFVYNIIVPAEYYTQKTGYIMFGTMIAAVINVIANYIFIRQYGFIAAAYTTLFAYVCYLLLHIFISHRLVGFHIIEANRLLMYFAFILFSSMINIFFLNNIPARYVLCVVSLLFLGMIVLKSILEDRVNIIKTIS